MEPGARGGSQPWRAGAQLGDGAVWAQPGPAPVPTQLQPGALGWPRSRPRGVAHGIGSFPGAWAQREPEVGRPGAPKAALPWSPRPLP